MSICHDRLDTCCQLPDLKTPYSCDGWDHPHCCGTSTPACGADPSCENLKGDADVTAAESALAPSTVADVPTGTGTGTGSAAVEGRLATVTAERGPEATAGAVGVPVGRGGGLVVVVAAFALLY
ncbi:hypothetical protein K491DRAFT_781607 [Lophiostoma macrostomum CBS 122681]|uniref:Uncharacterized protein n=1 Tax=Lophiostoma macrostomum CBS 122681 TaxID=1314788 RepID=A0A6A6SVX6_9PLEO|nr:hypothetical protein K491DRAFT_781607 [Lophiostoma macrostomum CBS 122681]